MGIHPSLIIHYFASKENMVSGLVDLVLESHSNRFSGLPSFDSSPEQRLKALVERIWSGEWHARTDISVIYAVLSVGYRNLKVFGRILDLYNSYRLFLINEFTRFRDAGIISCVHPQNTADIIISMSEGSHYFMPFHIKHEDTEAHRRRMIDAALKLLDYRGL